VVQDDTIYLFLPESSYLFLPESSNPSREELMALLMEVNSLLIPWVESIDISSAVLLWRL
jgi:hypothetical protein